MRKQPANGHSPGPTVTAPVVDSTQFQKAVFQIWPQTLHAGQGIAKGTGKGRLAGYLGQLSVGSTVCMTDVRRR